MGCRRTGASGVTMKYSAEPAGRPSRNGAGSPPGAIRWLLINVTRTKPHVAWGSSLSRARTSSALKSLVIRVEDRTSQIERPLSSRLMDIEPEISNSKDRTSVIDVIAHDPKTGEASLLMNAPHEWDSSDEQ